MSGMSTHFLRYNSKSESTQRRLLSHFLRRRLACAEAQGNEGGIRKAVHDKAEK